MKLEGSCHCRAVRFTVNAPHPVPFNLCYCSICRKTAGSGGHAINLGAEAASLEVTGREHVSTCRATPQTDRAFCACCGTALWVWSADHPDLIHPHAGAIDTDLPIPPERTHLMPGSRANWAVPQAGPDDKRFDGYPDESLSEWHDRTGLTQ